MNKIPPTYIPYEATKISIHPFDSKVTSLNIYFFNFSLNSIPKFKKKEEIFIENTFFFFKEPGISE